MTSLWKSPLLNLTISHELCNMILFCKNTHRLPIIILELNSSFNPLYSVLDTIIFKVNSWEFLEGFYNATWLTGGFLREFMNILMPACLGIIEAYRLGLTERGRVDGLKGNINKDVNCTMCLHLSPTFLCLPTLNNFPPLGFLSTSFLKLTITYWPCLTLHLLLILFFFPLHSQSLTRATIIPFTPRMLLDPLRVRKS